MGIRRGCRAGEMGLERERTTDWKEMEGDSKGAAEVLGKLIGDSEEEAMGYEGGSGELEDTAFDGLDNLDLVLIFLIRAKLDGRRPKLRLRGIEWSR
jgi:hypothetical protein